MPSSLTAGFTISYNGYTFDHPSTVIREFRSEPEWDESGRVIKWLNHSITIETWVQSTPPTTTDSTITTMRSALEKAGGRLSISLAGTGGDGVNLNSFSVNVSGVRDVAWGPKPGPLVVQPFTAYNAQVIWTVSFALLNCGSSRSSKLPVAFTYSPVFTIDRDGWSRIVWTGSLEIAMSKNSVGDTHLPDSVDEYLEAIQVPIYPTFQRVSQERRISADKRRLDFTYVDEQMPTPYPAGFTYATGSHELTSRGGSIFLYSGRLEFSARPAKGFTSVDAFKYWTDLIRFHVPSTAIPRQMRVSRDLFGTGISFSLAYDLIPKGDPKELKPGIDLAVKDTRFFDPPPGLDPVIWAKSIAETVGVRGRAGLKVSAADDALVDPCISGTGGIEIGVSLIDQAKQAAKKPVAQLFDKPPRDVLRKFDVEAKSWPIKPGIIHEALAALPSGGLVSAIQKHINNLFYLTLHFDIVRDGYPVPEPRVKSIEGGQFILKDRWVRNWPRQFTDAGVPMFRSSGVLTYMVQMTGDNVLGGILVDDRVRREAQEIAVDKQSIAVTVGTAFR